MKKNSVANINPLHEKWFWYSIVCVIAWAGWAITAKLGSVAIPEKSMQFIFTIGAAPIPIVLLIQRRFRLEKSVKGITYSLGHGILSGVGGLALFAAYRTGTNTAVVTAVTALYPIVTVVLAVILLRENLQMRQIAGLLFAAISMVLFSL